MSIRLMIYPSGFLHATVEDNFDFETSRTLLIEARKFWRSGGRELFLSLHRVTRANACAIGTMALLSEMAVCNFHFRIDHCSDDVEKLFGSGLLDRHFPQELLESCQRCMIDGKRACAEPVIATGIHQGALAA